MRKYSVIIPVYNAGLTLGRCLTSLVSQGRQDIQIIVVNDGSTDSSEAVIKDFLGRFPEIEYMYQENSGVSKARNAGLKQASGKYITFIDSDDYVADGYFSMLDQYESADLLVFDHEIVGGSKKNQGLIFQKLGQMGTVEEKMELLLSSRIIMSPCNKRFKSSILKRERLEFNPDMHIGEDFDFCMAYAACCNTIETLPNRALFVDISDQSSLSRKYRPELDQNMRLVFESVANTVRKSKFQRDKKERLLRATDYLFVKNAFSCICEEFKRERLGYFQNRDRIAEICRGFRKPYSGTFCNAIHFGLRMLLKWKIYYPFYLVSYLKKGRCTRT